MTIAKRIAAHKSICQELTNLYKVKNERYGNSFEKTYNKHGLVASAIRIEDKLNRMTQLMKDTELETADESLRDTMIDLANYTIMTLMEFDKDQGSSHIPDNEKEKKIKASIDVTLYDDASGRAKIIGNNRNLIGALRYVINQMAKCSNVSPEFIIVQITEMNISSEEI